MKFLIIDTYYPGFLKSFYNNHPELIGASYLKQKKSLIAECFGTSDYYSYNLKKLGHQADDLILNSEILQQQWAKENNLKVSASGLYQKLQLLPLVHRVIGRPKWVQKIALTQIKKYEPDIIYVQDLSILNPDTLKEAKKYSKIIVGQIACPLPAKENLKCFDLILTSFPHFVPMFRKMGINSEYLKISFDPRVLKKIGPQKRTFDVSFIGSFSPHHNAGTKLLESVAKQIPIHVWGQGLQYLSPNSPLRKNFHGEAWGLEMYKILGQSKIVLNRHISVAKNYANNMRLYETTGMGAMLITDDKKNLNELFKVGDELISYKSKDELIKKIKKYLNNNQGRDKIARQGQKRTLKDYTYQKRMSEMAKIVERYLAK